MNVMGPREKLTWASIIKNESVVHKQKVKRRKKIGPTGSRTQVAGFKVQSANHYTIEPLLGQIRRNIILYLRRGK